jgi:ubiquinone/menaquinone biosynthesis C-methylase UbiE
MTMNVTSTPGSLRPGNAGVSPRAGWFYRFVGRGSYPWLRAWIDPSREYTQVTYARTLRQSLTPATRWLDAGCGHLISTVWSAEQEREVVDGAGRVVGCDVDPSGLRGHRTVRNRVVCTLDDLPFPNRSFDLVTLNMVVEHLADPALMFFEVARVLDDGGRVIIHTPNASSYFVILMRLGNRAVPTALRFRIIRYLESRVAEDVFPAHYGANSARRLRRMATDAGLVEDQLLLLPDRPLFYFIAPLSLMELAITKLLVALGGRAIAANTMLATYRRDRSHTPPR